jgi:2-methylcitrate dehydratase
LKKDNSKLNEISFHNIITNYLDQEVLLDDSTVISVKLALLDTIGCILDASSSSQALSFATRGEEAEIGNPFNYANKIKSSRDLGRFFTTLIRWHDYNDTFLAREWAHPSDNIGSLFSYFLLEGGSIRKLSESIVRTYEIQGALSLATSLNQQGYDHVFFVKMASSSVYSHLITKGDTEVITRTINNVLLDGPTLRTYRHTPNVGRRKSWAAGDAISRAIELSEISILKDEKYEGILKDKTWGFESVFFEDEMLTFGKSLDNWVINNVLFKVLYPAEFHGQSAVEAAVQLSEEYLEKQETIKEVVVETHEPAIRIISNKDILNNASDRDHSLEYMVSAALLFGDVISESYEESFHGYENIEELRKKIKVIENPNFTKTYYEFEKREIANSVYLSYSDGTKSEKITVRYPIGHPNRREEAIPLIKEKFIKNTSKYYDPKKADDVWDSVMKIDLDADFTNLTTLLKDD